VARLGKSILAPALLLLVVGVAACGSTASGPLLAHCPKGLPGISGGGSPGIEGETVKTEPSSALICRWRGNEHDGIERDEIVARGAGLTRLVDALNSLAPGQEGDYACPDGPPLEYLVDLRYLEASDIEVEVEYDACGDVRTEDGYWWASGELEKVMNALLAGWVPVRHRSKPPFFTTP
jgi:hypothetical protein